MLSFTARLVTTFFLFLTLANSTFGQQPIFEHKQDLDRGAVKCEICQAVIYELAKKLAKDPEFNPSTTTTESNNSGKKKNKYGAREHAVAAALEKLCEVSSFSRYEFSPPSMIKACNELRSEAEESIETLFLSSSNLSEQQIRDKICIKETKRCTKLWTKEQFDDKREKTPEELAAQQEKLRAQQAAREAAKKTQEKEVQEQGDRIEL
jgi:hypothetical protein